MRLYTPAGHSSRAIFNPTSLPGPDGKIHIMTPPLDIYIEQSIIHWDPEIWGEDATEFRPSRWINDSGGLITPEKGTFMPFSQVEFVATMLSLFRHNRCAPLSMPDDNSAEPLIRLKRAIEDTVTNLTIMVNDPKTVQLKWTPLACNQEK